MNRYIGMKQIFPTSERECVDRLGMLVPSDNKKNVNIWSRLALFIGCVLVNNIIHYCHAITPQS